MIASWKCLCIALVPILTSCATSQIKPAALLPPRIDCAEYDAPRKARPIDPALTEKSPIVWQLYAYGWKDYAESLLEQRIATAVCMEGNRKVGNIR